MYFGDSLNVLLEASIDGIDYISNAISHLIKYSDERQRHKQSNSWVDTILAANKNLIENEKHVKKAKTNYINNIKKEYDNKILRNVNKELKSKAGCTVDKIPEEFSYEFITDTDKVKKFLADNVYDDLVMNYLDSKKIEISPEVRKRCIKKFK